ncbi:TonB-dependent receptor [Aggregatibacter actinomycetemcomitans]|uniref:TonB-dependent receptor plug domain-containing protein n=1 Tax=Aggregatibacter actinomycetemcomitans TaxID=714 RepID=UPI00197BCF38|nr:TonB-dependent receptor [Aggregatibacter actinomycetemcomitans]MBN6061820.1 TonB-dependent receptor [Aggregatibacter actinomycetemcomitans]UEL53129.1 TonB-dependent receptor [Aggregatibacter actinomycetemcomitans]
MKKTLLCTAITMACLPAYAEEVFALGQIEVIADKSTDLSTARIDQAELQKNNQTNVAEVAKTTPGVFLDRSGARNEYNLSVRGFKANRVPVFIDGIPVYVPYDGNMDIGRFTTFDLSRIDISKGASSVLYGANTLGGAVNLITQKPTKPFEGTIGYGFAHGRSGSTGTNQIYFNLGSKQDYFYTQLSGSFLEKQGLQLSRHYHRVLPSGDDGARAENSVQRDKKLSLKVAFTPNATDEYALVLSTQKSTKQQPLYSGKTARSERYWRWPQWDKDSIYFLSHTQFDSHNIYLNTKAFFDTFKNELDSFDDAGFSRQTGSNRNSYYRDYAYGAGFELGGDLTSNDTLKFSAILKQDVHREHNSNEPTAVDKDRTYSFGLENTYRFSERTKLITGMSFDRREAKRAENYQARCPATNVRSQSICPFDVADKNAFNYQIKLVHSFDEQDEFSLGFAKKTRFPTMKDRYSYRLNRAEPNPFLDPEIAYHYEAGYTRTFGNWLRLDGALFYSEVRDAIELVAHPTISNKEQNQNYGKEVFKGVELAAAIFATDNLTLGANYTYTRAKNKTYTNFIVRDIPQHKFFAYVDWKIVPNLSLYVSQEAEHGRYSRDGFGSRAPTVRLSGFGNTNAKLTYNVTEQFTVEAGVFNLFDKNYYYEAGYPEAGRVYFSNLKYRF